MTLTGHDKHVIDEAARLNGLQQALDKITVHPDETGHGRVRASHPDDGTYVIKSVAFPAGQSVTLAQIVAEFEDGRSHRNGPHRP